jgi:hypothetical protein
MGSLVMIRYPKYPDLDDTNNLSAFVAPQLGVLSGHAHDNAIHERWPRPRRPVPNSRRVPLWKFRMGACARQIFQAGPWRFSLTI